MTTEKRQSSNRRIVRHMAVAVLVMAAIAFSLYAFAAWSASVINCAEGSPALADCAGARRAMWVFSALTVATLLGAAVAWRKLDA